MIADRLDKQEMFQFLRPDQVRAVSDVATVVEFEACYTIQTHISRIYFKRYISTMKKLQPIVMDLPLEPVRVA